MSNLELYSHGPSLLEPGAGASGELIQWIGVEKTFERELAKLESSNTLHEFGRYYNRDDPDETKLQVEDADNTGWETFSDADDGESRDICGVCRHLSPTYLESDFQAISVDITAAAEHSCKTCLLLSEAISELVPSREGQRLGWLQWESPEFYWPPTWIYAIRYDVLVSWWFKDDVGRFHLGLCTPHGTNPLLKIPPSTRLTLSQGSEIANPLDLPSFGYLADAVSAW
jgi:hypothetical protein